MYPYRKHQMRDYYTIIHYHQVSPVQFRKHMQYLEKKYTLCRLDQLRDHYKDGTKLPHSPLFITFDDGWKSNYDLLPVIEELDYPITIFLSTGLVGTGKKPGKKILDDDFKLDENLLGLISGKINETPPIQVSEDIRTMLSKGEIKEMSKHVDFQSHGVNHQVFSVLSKQLMEYELEESKHFIQELTGKDVFAFAFPYNVVSEEIYPLLIKHGYLIARAGARKYNKIGTSPYGVNSIGIPPHWTVKELRKSLLLAELKALRAS